MLLLLALPSAAPAQTAEPPSDLSGRVIDAETGRPIAGVAVRLEGGSATLTDADGFFRVQARTPVASIRLRFEHIAYAPRTVAANGGAASDLTVELQPAVIAVEGVRVVVDVIRERFERRRNASAGVVFTYETDALLALGVPDGFRAFWKIVRMARPCPSGPDYCLFVGGRDRPVVVCIDERPAWGGVLELADYRPEELFLVEVYQRGLHIRAYTNDWVRSQVARRQLLPVEGAC